MARAFIYDFPAIRNQACPCLDLPLKIPVIHSQTCPALFFGCFHQPYLSFGLHPESGFNLPLGNPNPFFIQPFPQFNSFHQILRSQLARFIQNLNNADGHLFDHHHGGSHHDLL